MNNDPIIQDINREIERSQVIDYVTATAYVLGVISGIILASFLHKYIVHPLGW